MARGKKGRGSWAGGKAPAQGSASTGQKSKGATGNAFRSQIGIDSHITSIRPGVWHPGAVKP